MVLVQLIYGGSNILIKFSLAEGLNPIVFVVYRGMLEKLKIRTARGQDKVAGTLFCIGGFSCFHFLERRIPI
ncbi:unnamed protein product [Prunus armeniaca]